MRGRIREDCALWPLRAVFLRAMGWLLGVGGSLLFLAGSLSLNSGLQFARVLSPGVAVLVGGLSFMTWFVLQLLRNDAVKPKPRWREL